MSGTYRIRDFTSGKRDELETEIHQDYNEMQEALYDFEGHMPGNDLVARLERMKTDNPFGLATVSYDTFADHIGEIKRLATANVEEAQRRLKVTTDLFPLIASYDKYYAERMREYVEQAEELRKYMDQVQQLLHPTGDVFPLDMEPADFATRCTDTQVGMDSYQTRREATAYANSLRGLDGTYDWDAIEEAWQSDELTDAQFLALTTLYTEMDGEDAQKFINLAYVHPSELLCETSSPAPNYYYEYTNLDGSVTRVYTYTSNPANIRVVSPAFWQFSQFYVACSQQIVGAYSTEGSFDDLSEEQVEKLQGMAAHASVLTQVLLYNSVWEPTWIKGEPSFTIYYPVKSLTFYSSGGYTMEQNQRIWNYVNKAFETKPFTIKGSPLSFEKGDLSEWLLDVVLKGEAAAANQKAMDSFFSFMKATAKIIGKNIPVLGDIMLVVGLIDSIVGVYAMFDNLHTAVDHWVGAEGSPVAICKNQQDAAAYFKRLNVLGATATATVMGENGQVMVTVYQYSTAISYINWRQYCRATGDDSIGYDEFVQAMLNPEETANSWAIMKWVNVMKGTAKTTDIFAAFTGYLNNGEFLEQYPEQDWPDNVNACTLEQLEILYDYHKRQKGW